MQRELVWIKEKSRWGCTECAWVFSADNVRMEGTLEDMLHGFEEERQREFHQHSCAHHPKPRHAKHG
jgi:hypothetical protein